MSPVQSGSDGTLAAGTNEFERGVIYTVDPCILAPLASGEDYRIVASTRFRRPKDETFTGYEPLYRRAREIVERRKTELTCASQDAELHTWIVSHGWFRMEIRDSALVGAVVTLGVRSAPAGTQPPSGQDAPTPAALTSPYVEQLGGQGGQTGALWFDEFYNDFDTRLDRASAAVMTISYGEYVSSPDEVDFDAVIVRAEHRARMYVDLVKDDGEQLEIAQREWRCLDTGKSAKPFLTHVNLVFKSLRTTRNPNSALQTRT
jgi:hypothetical protein